MSGYTYTERRQLEKWKRQAAKRAEPVRFMWTPEKRMAVELLAQGQTNKEVANQIVIDGRAISDRTVDRWKKAPEFVAAVAEEFETWKAQVRKRGLAIKEKRIQSLIDDFDRTEIIVKENVEFNAGKAPGGNSGFIVVVEGGITTTDENGNTSTTAGVYQFDSNLMKARLALRKQIAQELGQWTDRTEVSGPDGGAIEINVTDMSGNPIRDLGPDALAEIMQLIKGQLPSPQMPQIVDITPISEHGEATGDAS